MTVEYNPQVFNSGTLTDAMGIILTQEDEWTTQDRWVRETPYLADLIVEQIKPNQNSLILDYGCGIGRLAAELIRRTGCYVVGADISPSMRAFAADYVKSERFVACHPDALELFPPFDGAIAVWVLQHCPDVKRIADTLNMSMKTDAPLFVVNNKQRVIPFLKGTEFGWANDNVDVDKEVSAVLRKKAEGTLDPERVGKIVAEFSYWSVHTA